MDSEVKTYIERIYNVNGEGYNGGSLRAAEMNNNNPIYAIKAVEMTEQIMKKKAVEAFIESCEYKSDWCCGCAEAHGSILSEPDICIGEKCPSVKRFIDKLNNE